MGNSPLYFAVKNKDIPTIQLLIEYGADVNKNINALIESNKKKIKNYRFINWCWCTNETIRIFYI